MTKKLNQIIDGQGYPFGSTWDREGVNFALFSAHAEKVELCLFDESGQTEVSRHELPGKTGDVWHGYLPGLAAGTVYGYRVYGPFDPHSGHRFNHHKLLLDPYARQLIGSFHWNDRHFAYQRGASDVDLSFDARDNANWTVKAVVTLPHPPSTSAKPTIPWHQTSIYETHVRGFTRLHPELIESQRGTFTGLCDDKVIDYIKALGITSIELLPVHAFIDEYHLHRKRLTNYWGYNTLNFFTPHRSYQSGQDAMEFQHMVERLHAAGLEVILDVVYNHTCEGDCQGPTLSYRGIDNASYYQLEAEQSRYYVNDTGCGNTLNLSHPRVLQLVMDSLRYWSHDMGVDGFRFDLATVLGRGPQGYNPEASFFQTLAQDPQLSGCKLIAEPWDVGPGGYQSGNFPALWSEWNDDYRDTVRRFWRREPGMLPTFARRLHGSSDIFEHTGRKPRASINYIASHDGFTLRDLVSFNNRHNEENGEHNNDGHRENLSENFGVEGAADDPSIEVLRRRQQRNLLVTLMISQGVPMLTAGDERNRSQQGNNNAYCQDTPLNWIDWRDDSKETAELSALVRYMLKLRREFPVLQSKEYIHQPPGQHEHGIIWLNSDGEAMRDQLWHEHDNFVLGYMLSSLNANSNTHYLLAIFNNTNESREFKLPEYDARHHWQWLVDTGLESGIPETSTVVDNKILTISHRSVAILSTVT